MKGSRIKTKEPIDPELINYRKPIQLRGLNNPYDGIPVVYLYKVSADKFLEVFKRLRGAGIFFWT